MRVNTSMPLYTAQKPLESMNKDHRRGTQMFIVNHSKANACHWHKSLSFSKQRRVSSHATSTQCKQCLMLYLLMHLFVGYYLTPMSERSVYSKKHTQQGKAELISSLLSAVDRVYPEPAGSLREFDSNNRSRINGI